MKRYRAPDDPWWETLRADLVETAAALRIANMGTLLGPPLVRYPSGQIELAMEVPFGRDVKPFIPLGLSRRVHVSYPSSLPDPIEPEAVIWDIKDAGDGPVV